MYLKKYVKNYDDEIMMSNCVFYIRFLILIERERACNIRILQQK
jgi:hypothetical protein